MTAVYTNYWSKFREPSHAERLARAAKAREELVVQVTDDDDKFCPYLTKKGAPCSGYATETGACVGHQKMLEAGKELTLA